MISNRQLDWLNLNSHRAYPIKEDTDIGIGNNFLVDFRLTAKNQEVTQVTLDRIDFAGDLVFLVDDTEITVDRYTGAAIDYRRYFIDTDDFTIVIVFGDYSMGSMTNTFLGYPIEESCYTSQYDYRVDTITGDDTLYGPQLYDAGIIPTTPSGIALSGDIIIECGYNISAAITDNIIQFVAIPGYGDIPGDHCLKLHTDIDCRDTILYLNGVQADTYGTIDLKVGTDIESRFIGDTIELKSGITGIKPYCRESING